MLSVTGELDLHHPEPWEVMFSSDFSDRPPTMTWRYPEPRALSAVDLVPLPLSTPVLVNTLNMGDEYQVTLNTPFASFFGFSLSERECNEGIDSMLVKGKYHANLVSFQNPKMFATPIRVQQKK